jgi:hypothetical protein
MPHWTLGIECWTRTVPLSLPSRPRAGEQGQTLATASHLPFFPSPSPPPSALACAVPAAAAGLSPHAWSGGAAPTTRGGVLRPSSGPGAARMVSVAVTWPLGGRVPW